MTWPEVENDTKETQERDTGDVNKAANDIGDIKGDAEAVSILNEDLNHNTVVTSVIYKEEGDKKEDEDKEDEEVEDEDEEDEDKEDEEVDASTTQKTINFTDIENAKPRYTTQKIEALRKNIKETEGTLNINLNLPKKIEDIKKIIKEKEGKKKELEKSLKETNNRLAKREIRKEIGQLNDDINKNNKGIESLNRQKVSISYLIKNIQENINILIGEYNKATENGDQWIINFTNQLTEYGKYLDTIKTDTTSQETIVSQKEPAQTKPSQWKNNPKLTLDLFKNIGEIFKSINLVKGDFFWNIGRIWDAFTGETTTQKLKKNQNIEQNDEVIKILSNLATKKRPDNNEPKLVNEIINTITSWTEGDIKNLQMKLRTPNNKISITWKIDINTAQILEGYIKNATTDKLNVSIENMEYSCVDWFKESENSPFSNNADDFWWKMYEKTNSNWRSSYLLVWYKGSKDFIASGITKSWESYSYEGITVQWSDWTKEEWEFDDNLELTNWKRYDSDHPKGQQIKWGQVEKQDSNSTEWNTDNPTQTTSSGSEATEESATPDASWSTATAQ